MKNVIKVAIFTLFVLLLLPIVSRAEVTSDTIYYDWSDISDFKTDYSYSTLFYSENTEIKIIKEAGTITYDTLSNDKKVPKISNITQDEELIILVTNAAVNENGEILDAVIKISDVIPWVTSGGGLCYSLFSN